MTDRNQEKLGLSAFIGMLLGGIFGDLLGPSDKENIIYTTSSSKEVGTDQPGYPELCEEYFDSEDLDIDLF